MKKYKNLRSCKNCGKIIGNYVVIDGIRHHISSRLYCTDCNPIGSKKFWGGSKDRKTFEIGEDGKKRLKIHHNTCQECEREFSGRTSGKSCPTCISKKNKAKRLDKIFDITGDKCIACDNSEKSSLCFHHLDPSKKELKISKFLCLRWDKIKKELENCVVLCHNCHRECHAGLFEIDSDKKTIHINTEYSEEVFEIRKTENHWVWKTCKCGIKHRTTLNTDKCKKCRAKNKRKYRKTKLVKMMGGKCSVCEYDKCLDAFDFHHVNKNDKKHDISSMMLNSWKAIIKESGKCVLVCANCHQFSYHNEK